MKPVDSSAWDLVSKHPLVAWAHSQIGMVEAAARGDRKAKAAITSPACRAFGDLRKAGLWR